MDVERRRFYWKIDNFGLYFLTQTEPLESPPFQIAGVASDVSFCLAICKETRKQDIRVACFLFVSGRSRAPMSLRIEGTVLLKLPNKITKIAVVQKSIGSTLLIGKTAWSQTIFPGNDLAKGSLSVMCSLWRSPLIGSKHCSAVTLVKYQKKKLVEKLRLSNSFPMIKSQEILIDSSDECVKVHSLGGSSCNEFMLLYYKKWIQNKLANIRLTLMNNSNIPLKSMKPKYNPTGFYHEFWYLKGSFTSGIINKNNTNYFKNNSPMYLKIEAEMSMYDEFGSFKKYFSDSHLKTSKKLRHRLKNDLERFFISNRNGCDLILRCENKDFPVHKSLICCKSPVFNTMFESDMKEKKLGMVEIDDIDSLTLSRFIEYLYLGYVTDSTLDLDSAMSLYAIAHKYSIEDLVNYSRQFLVLNMDCGNSDEMLRFSDLYDDKSLKNLIDYCFYHKDD
ncbi:TD and POZ domain-containing protein 3 [Trichonephila clavata]|uniref:TD and POZ domain-containing protein 3 n=1 Tax=Trichonephila clavata TaxID=2740835 RepID=A0A8X6HW34_TRICU|nr:TD and POZ domain-containing protein 3 [Trichonephila clavata]